MYELWAGFSSSFDHTSLLQEGEPLPGPKYGLLSNFPKWIVRGDTCADKARDFIEKGHLGEEQQGKGAQENCSATWLTVSGFMIMELISGLRLANRLAWPVVSLRVLPGGTCISQPRRTVRRSLESWCPPPPLGLSSVLPVTFSGSTLFLTRISCC